LVDVSRERLSQQRELASLISHDTG
jgi:hypothetical protein